MPDNRPRLLIVTHDVIDAKVSGLGMRYLEFSRALAADLAVTLASPYESSLTPADYRLARYSETNADSLRQLVDAHDVALISGFMVARFPFLQTTSTRLIVDWITPFILENLHYHLQTPIEAREGFMRQSIHVTNLLARTGDFFICGSERQRDFWMGVLAANYRLNPRTSSPESTGHNLIDVVGFGLPERPPVQSQPVLLGVHPRCGPDSKIVWWGGGAWDWLDPVTLVRAWPQVIARHPEARLVFLSTQPNPLVPQAKKAIEIERLATEYGERDKTIFFLEWLSYEARESMLCEAHVGAVLHPLHLETHFSVRTRVMDYIWAGLPILITEGDVMSEVVRAQGLGRVIPAQNPEAAAVALNELLGQPKSAWAAAFAAYAESARWSRIVEPIRRYCLENRPAPDRVARQLVSVEPPAQVTQPNLILRGLAALRIYGLREVIRHLYQLARHQMLR